MLTHPPIALTPPLVFKRPWKIQMLSPPAELCAGPSYGPGRK